MTAAAPRAKHTIAIGQVERSCLARAAAAGRGPLARERRHRPALWATPLSRVTQAQYARLTHRLRDELWGLCSRSVPPGAFAQTCRLLVGCRTLGEALEIGLRQYRLLIDDFTPRLQRRGALVSVSVAPRRPFDPTLADAQRVFCFLAYGLASSARPAHPVVERELPGLHAWPGQRSRVGFPGARPVRRPAHGLTFGEGRLELPVVHDARTLSAFLRRAPARLLAKYRDHASVTERIRRLLLHQLAADLPSLAQVARQLELTPHLAAAAPRRRTGWLSGDQGRPAPRRGRGIPCGQRHGAVRDRWPARLLGSQRLPPRHQALDRHGAEGLPAGAAAAG